MNNVIKMPHLEEVETIFPTQVYGAHKAIIGMAGSGKTVVAKKYVEQLLTKPRRVVIIDPTGAWWGMRLMADGASPSPYPLLIMGGEHGDRPLQASMGTMFGQIVARSQICMIFDLSHMTQEDQRIFTADFLTAVHQDNRKPLHLIIDEADEFAPQRAAAYKPCRDALIRIMQRGRVKGIAVTLVTQRLAVMDKTALGQAKAMVIMGFALQTDRKIVHNMVASFPNPTLVKSFEDSLASLKVGEGWIWCQPLNKLVFRQYPFIDTYNSSPTFSFEDEFTTEDRVKTVLPSLNLSELDELLANGCLPPEIEEESEEIRLLRASHADLVHQIELMEERERQMIIDGQASHDISLSTNDRTDIDQALLHLAIGQASRGNAFTVEDLIQAAGIEVRPLAHRSILRLTIQGKIVIRDGLVWPTADTLRRADRSDEDFADSVNVDLSNLVMARPIMSAPERVLSDKLISAAGRLKLHVLPQVGMGAFIETIPGIDANLAARARHAFAGRYVDYVLCNRDGTVKAIVELDDSTHDSVTDALRDAVASAAGIPTLRLLSIKGMTINLLAGALQEMLRNEQPELNHPSFRRACLAA